jgi:hypothetical protein
VLIGTDVDKKLNSKLECPKCQTIYLTLTQNMTLSTLIHCSSCGEYLGTWAELESDFIAQGGTNGVFRMDRGEIIKIDDESLK